MHEVLKKDPINIARKEKGLPQANIVTLRGCGVKIEVKSFNERHNLNGWAVCPTAILNGLSQSIGLKTFKVPGATGDYHSNLLCKAEKAVDLFLNGVVNEETKETEHYEFGFLHIKQVDESGHDKS